VLHLTTEDIAMTTTNIKLTLKIVSI